MKTVITKFIPFGRENAVSGRDLCIITGLDARTVKAEIANERLHGAVICSDLDGNSGGYFQPTAPEEAMQYVRTEQKRIESAKRALQAAVNFVKGDFDADDI